MLNLNRYKLLNRVKNTRFIGNRHEENLRDQRAPAAIQIGAGTLGMVFAAYVIATNHGRMYG